MFTVERPDRGLLLDSCCMCLCVCVCVQEGTNENAEVPKSSCRIESRQVHGLPRRIVINKPPLLIYTGKIKIVAPKKEKMSRQDYTQDNSGLCCVTKRCA